MARAAPFILIAAAFAAGIWLAEQLALPRGIAEIIAALAFVVLIIARRIRFARWALALLIIAALGAMRYAISAPLPGALTDFHGRFVAIEGVVVDEPAPAPSYTSLRVRTTRVVATSIVTPTDDLLLVRVDNAIHWRYGDVIRAFGFVNAPPRLGTFDYREYLARKGIFSIMSRPDEALRIGEGQGSPLTAALLDVRDALRRSAQQVVPAPESALLNGILIGDDSEMPAQVNEAFRRTGTSHLVAISGFNVTIVIALVVPALSRLLNKRRAALVAIPAIVLYTLLTGASASVVRAALMAIITLAGLLFWRRGFTLNTLCAAAFAMFVIDPYNLYDLGFQLSFVATLGLVLYSDYASALVDRGLERMQSERARKWLGAFVDTLAVTLAAQITTTPLILALQSQLSVVSLPVNLLVLWLQPAAMVLGIIAAVVGLFSASLGSIVALPTYALLTFTLRVVEWAGGLPFATIPVFGFGAREAVICYVALFALVLFITSSAKARQVIAAFLHRRMRWVTLAVIGVIALVIGFVALSQRPDGRLHVTLSGAGAFIQTPAGKQVLFAPDGALLAALGRSMPLWDKGVELLILPERTDRARGNALPIVERYRIGMVTQPPGEDEPTAMLREWDALAKKQVDQVTALPLGTVVMLEPGVVLTIVQRLENRYGARLTYGSATLELVGDASAITGTLDGAAVVFIGARGNTAPPLNAAHPRIVVWADAGGTEPRLADGITVLRLREMDELVLVSDGVNVEVHR